jgi:hypothetical protein
VIGLDARGVEGLAEEAAHARGEDHAEASSPLACSGGTVSMKVMAADSRTRAGADS